MGAAAATALPAAIKCKPQTGAPPETGSCRPAGAPTIAPPFHLTRAPLQQSPQQPPAQGNQAPPQSPDYPAYPQYTQAPQHPPGRSRAVITTQLIPPRNPTAPSETHPPTRLTRGDRRKNTGIPNSPVQFCELICKNKTGCMQPVLCYIISISTTSFEGNTMSFIRALFDFSFSEFITTKIIKLLVL